MASRGVKLLGLVLGLGLFAWVIRDALAQAQGAEWPPIPWVHVALATLLVIAAHGCHGLAWAVGARHVARGLGLMTGTAIYALSFLGRYLPGKIWQIGAMSYLARDRGDPYQIAGYSLVFLIIFQGIGASILVIATLGGQVPGAVAICLFGTIVITGFLAVLYYLASGWIVARLPERMQQKLKGGLYQPFGPLLLNLLLLAACWLLFATGGYVLALGFAPDWTGSWAQATTAALTGLIAGFLVLIAPSGVGVRESAISVSLGSMGVEPVAAVALALALRLAMTLSELVWAGLGALVLMGPKGRVE
ncbi:MAG: lysylphosphatidylglycerol synthase domain-containing protein [Silicimonas sp.]|nr:lysylphosphatidylglycerol synthase domain-containing protein [Silicimonas sp.]